MTGPGLWHAAAAERAPADGRAPRHPPLDRDLEVDVAIVGAGFSGLWTAYHLLEAEPSLRVAVFERDRIGFGASGRNGGWLMAAAPADLRVWERRFGLDAVRRAQGVLIHAVGEIAAVADRLADVPRAGAVDLSAEEPRPGGVRLASSLTLARSAAEAHRLQARRAALIRWGWPEHGLTWLGGDEARAEVGAHGVRRALRTEPCGTLDPVGLIEAIAAAVVARGGEIHEGTEAAVVAPRALRAGAHTVRATTVVMATEAFTIERRHEGRRYLPLASTMIATAPLPADVRESVGWSRGQAIGDARHLFFYAQLTRDGRIAIGGRGAPYRLGSGLSIDGAADPLTTGRLEATLREVWPQAGAVPVEHRWAGSLAVPRDWCASCGVDRATGTAWIGGYAGHGVAASYVLARSLAAQVRGVDDPAGPQPWTLHRARRWEPEPLRWLASQAIVRTLGSADRIEAGGGTARRARVVGRFTG